MSEPNYFLVFVISFSTGVGTTFGTELAKELIEQVKKLKGKKLQQTANFINH